MSDQELIARVAEGSGEAFDSLYFAHITVVGRYAWGVSSSRESAQELVQDTFLTLWRNASRVRLVTDSALPWLLVTCRNLSLNLRRAEARHSRIVSALEKAMHSRHVIDDAPEESMRWIQEAIDRLPSHEALVVHLCLVEGHTYKNAAAALDLSDVAIAKRLERARTKLRKDLANEDA